MKLLKFIVLLLMCSIGATTVLQAQTKAHGRVVEAFPYPYNNIAFINPRFDRQVYDDGSYINTYTLRGVKTFNRHYHVKADIAVANSNASGTNVFGLGDMNIRMVHVSRLHHRWYIGYGLQADFPTATNEILGSGKFVARPGTGVIFFRGKSDEDVTGTISLAAEYRFSYAGDDSRSKVNRIAVSPNIDWWFTKWYFGYYASWIYDFESESFDLPLDIEVGYFILPRLALAAEFVQPLLKDAGYKNEFLVKLRFNL